MFTRGISYYEQHFIFSNRLVLFLLGNHTHESSTSMLVSLCGIFVFASPIIVYQFYQMYVLEMKLQSIMKVLKPMILALYILYCYSTIYLKLLMIKLIISHIKLDYKLLMNEKELNIMEKYLNQCKLYTSFLIGFFYFYFILLTSPSIYNVFQHIFGTLEDIHLTLPFPINNISHAGFLYYNLLIYQIIVFFVLITIGIIIYSGYWAIIQHICAQFKIFMEKVRRPFEDNPIHIENAWCCRTPQQEREWLIDIITCYNRVKELINLINKFSNMTYLIAVCVSMLLVILNFLYVFQLFSVLLNIRDIIEGITFTVGFIFTLYITFYIGQLLTNHSNAAFIELCNIPFYTLSIKTQKLLLLLLTRSVQPCEISIGNIFVASHRVFAAIIQKAFSFATVYYSMTYL